MDPFAIISFLAFTIAVAAIAWWKTRGEDLGHSTGYFLAGRSLGWVTIGGSLYLTNISTEQMVGLNGSAYTYGFSVMAWEVVAAVTMVLMAIYFLPRFLRRGVSTIPQMVAYRFGKNMQTTLSTIFIIASTINFLPFILYSGALALDGLFGVNAMLGLSQIQTLYVLCACIGVIGGCYSIFGGLKAVAVSDTINGAGLLIGGLAIPFLGLQLLGDGNLLEGLTRLQDHPEKLNPIVGGSDTFVPFSTVFTGMFIINMSYWCLNQFIVQRTFGARTLADGQKGVLFASAMKLVGVFMLVLPGVIAFHLFPNLEQADKAYPTLIAAVLPAWLNGLFGAVLFGAILSSFNSVVHSLSTMFSVDIYKRIKPELSDHETVRIGQTVGIVLILLAIGCAPLILFAEGGLYQAMKKLGAVTMMPMSVVAFAAIFIKRIPTKAAFGAFGFGVLFQIVFGVVFQGAEWFPVHFLHVVGINACLMLAIMYIASRVAPDHTEEAEMEPEFVTMHPWKGAIPTGIIITLLCVAIYAFLAYVGRGA